MRLFDQFSKKCQAFVVLAPLLVACQPQDDDKNIDSTQEITQTTQDDLKLHVPSPDWRDQIIYFVMIDRFADGQPTNNDQGAGEYEPGNNAKFQGGDLAGIQQQLDYIQGLGATAVWVTPPVANQWWDGAVNYGGYHGYWAEHFKEVDAHFGTLADYQQLSDALHRRGMYLVQDVVINHTGNFFQYKNGWSADDATAHFVANTHSVPVSKPRQQPFDQNDPRDPAQRDAAIYHWTPTVADVNVPEQELNHQLADLDDLNTDNPVVRHALRDSYGYWIREVGVDAFRVDTAFYVAADYFRDFLHADDSSAPGMLNVAKQTGREQFHVFGEGFGIDRAFDDSKARKIDGYMRDQRGNDLLPGMINFPLYGTLIDVFARGRPTAELGHRIQSVMTVHQSPHLMPTFVDNHDVDRFLSGGDLAGLKQSLLFLMTMPGIPTLYYGTEQAFAEQRASMFATGVGAEGRDHYDTGAPLYHYLKQVIALRKQHPTLSRGTPVVLASNAATAGALAVRMDYQHQPLLVLFNTSDREVLLDNLDTGMKPGSLLTQLFSIEDIDGSTNNLRVIDDQGRISLRLPARAGMVYAVAIGAAGDTKPMKQEPAPTLVGPTGNHFRDDFTVSGTSTPGASLAVVVDGKLATAQQAIADATGRWQATIDTRDFIDAATPHTVVAWSAAQELASNRYTFTVQRSWQPLAELTDPADDDHGPNGRYRYPTEATWQGKQPMDIRKVVVASSGGALKVDITMRELLATWNPPNGFDHLALTVFLQVPNDKSGAEEQPLQAAKLPATMHWNYRLRINGWSNAMFSADTANANNEGKAIRPGAQIKVDPASNTITVLIPAETFAELKSWHGGKLYLNAWDYDGRYKSLADSVSPHQVSNDGNGDALIMDDIAVLALP